MSENHVFIKSMECESMLQFILMIFNRCSKFGLFIISVLLFVLLNTGMTFANCSDTLTSEDPYSLAYGDGIDGPYIDNGNGTVTDNGNNLMWQKSDDGKLYDWQTSCQYCEDLQLGGYSDWELPDIYQLSTINDVKYLPTVNTNYFNNTKKAGYWTGSTNAQYTDSAWFVAFEDGYVNYSSKTTSYYVRCVRSGLSEPLVISINYSEANGKAPLTVSFSVRINGGMAPFSYSWNFGDATSKSTEEKPTHIYPNSGLYTVTVTVKDVNQQTAEQSVSINVSNTTNYTQSDMDAQYQLGRQSCINDPASCGLVVSSQECFPSNIKEDLTIYIPQLNYVSSVGTINLWANFEFVGENNGDYLWRLHEFGQK